MMASGRTKAGSHVRSGTATYRGPDGPTFEQCKFLIRRVQRLMKDGKTTFSVEGVRLVDRQWALDATN